MADAIGPNLLVVGGDGKRLLWLTHHVTSRWPSAQVTTAPSGDPAALSRLLTELSPDAVMLQADFADETASAGVLQQLTQLTRTQPALYCVVLADNGSEMTAVRAMKAGAKDYLPLARINREQLLTAITEAQSRRHAASQAAQVLSSAAGEVQDVAVPGYAIIKEISTSNFSKVYLARCERLRKNVVLKVMTRG